MDSKDIPQANKLDVVRLLVEGISQGLVSIEDLGAATELSARHVGYYLHAARVLRCIAIQDGTPVTTDAGRRLIATDPGSANEALEFKQLIQDAPAIREAVGDLFDDLNLEAISSRIAKAASLSESTALRRAGALTGWRTTVLARIQVTSTPEKTEPADSGNVQTAVARPESAPEPTAAEKPAGPSLPTVPAGQDSYEFPSGSLAYLRTQMQQARLVLLTGAGFCLDAKDHEGRSLPLGFELARELWPLAFPGEPLDTQSSLQDVFAEALERKRSELDAYLRNRLTVDADTLPDFYSSWFSAPWERIYTLNVDDLESAAGRAFKLPRSIVSTSALRDSTATLTPARLPVIHLNGVVTDGPELVTFSHSQYAQRLADQEPWYSRLAADLAVHPFVFVGSPIEEPLFWEHLQIRDRRLRNQKRELRPRSFLVSPKLPVARAELLRRYNIEWVRMTANAFAAEVLSQTGAAISAGLDVLRIRSRTEESSASNIQEVSRIVSEQPPPSRSLYLLGAEPTWDDILSERAIQRECDDELLSLLQSNLNSPDEKGLAPTIVLTGTAGSGKSSSLMRLSVSSSAQGASVSWIGREIEVTPRQIREHCERLASTSIVAIDDADRYGAQLPSLLRDLAAIGKVHCIILAMRASRHTILNSPALSDLPFTEFTMPALTDPDIRSLIQALDRDNRLGRLKGMSSEQRVLTFRQRADRQLLVAMIEATSGRKFDERVFDEWQELSEDARYLYAVTALASAFGGGIRRADLLLATGMRTPAELQALDDVTHRQILVVDATSARLRSRHRVIAEKLLSELSEQGTYLARVYRDLARAISLNVDVSTPRNAAPWRLLKKLLNHDRLRKALGLEGARDVYDGVSDTLGWDYHYWLQRGSLELEIGDIREAENFIGASHSMNDGDAYVRTAFGYMSMKRACCNSRHGDAASWVDEGIRILKEQIAARGAQDYHPYHILGSQGLSWSRRAGWSKRERRDFLRMLGEMLDNGRRHHPTNQELRRLAEDVTKELHGLVLD